jgi:hypothetical protein
MREDIGRRIQMEDIAGLCKTAFERCSNIGTIINGFPKTGVWPFNPSIFQTGSLEEGNSNQHNFAPPVIDNIDKDKDIVQLVDERGILKEGNAFDIEQMDIYLQGCELPLGAVVVPSSEEEPSVNLEPDTQSTVFQFVDLYPVPKIPCRKLTHRSGTAAILTSSQYKDELKEKLKKRSAKRKVAVPKINIEHIDYKCLICDDSWSESKPGEDWLQCGKCKGWLHAKCDSGSSLKKETVCENCRYRKIGAFCPNVCRVLPQ